MATEPAPAAPSDLETLRLEWQQALAEQARAQLHVAELGSRLLVAALADRPRAPRRLGLSFAEVAEALGVSERSIRRAAAEGRLGTVAVTPELHRIPAAELARWLADEARASVERRAPLRRLGRA